MPINNPSGEEHERQLRYRAEDLRGEIEELIAELDKWLGAENYTIDAEGNISTKLSELEIGFEKASLVKEKGVRLKDIYKEMKKIGERIGFGEVRKTYSGIIH